ncbi:riboflavin synthase [Thermotoga neapolitana]|uniref:Riboflavin synthase, alpha subunit n=1 Tax=Thermotoga neapolitana (strain ATCC 49049 / DSM 4359 / NBRC 107923 / NS-E) TaxID=309803 RepID=B9K7K2_THENN|nr:riboflavin synthase [Thermotoga neapolitana]ACM22935.1 Riboflavin synthase, alpha subunit [Thermotoga neapolitana DSM 4359]KFZ21978.1 riboflavin synthase subunit alpha [Thermotoga neapolitana LA10]HBF11278.1 riboflavin synthase [Thermotoga neapolitana]
MFTGIIQRVEEGVFREGRLFFKRTWEVEVGESVAVNGVCLTVSGVSENEYWFDVGEETKRRTNLSVSRFYNLEKALTFGSSVSGHLVTGHVDGVVRFVGSERRGGSVFMFFSMPEERWAVVPRGSIALNGVSLTVVETSLDTFSVQVIPHTFHNTNLRFLIPGDPVNYEIDIIARYLKGVIESGKSERILREW